MHIRQTLLSIILLCNRISKTFGAFQSAITQTCKYWARHAHQQSACNTISRMRRALGTNFL